ncbi:MAG: hypothetical protein Q7T49_01495 [bacterium]|nr:hypothetical protein [bacterium]
MNNKWLKIILFLLVFVALLWGAVLIRNNFVPVRGEPSSSNSLPGPQYLRDRIDMMRGDRFLFENLSLTVLDGWSKTNLSKTPVQSAEVLFAFKKTGTSCVLAYVESEGLISSPEWLQASWGDRIFTSDLDQLDGNWYVGDANKPANFKFSERNRQFLPGEILVNYYGINGLEAKRDSFLLFTNNGQSVPEECADNTYDILSSLQREYSETSLSLESKGYMYFRRSGQGKSETYPLLFLPAGSETEQKLFTFPSYPHNLTAYRNLLYYGGPSPEGERVSLYEFNPFTKKVRILTSLPKYGYAYINDILFKDSEVFYTYGEECWQQEKCSIDLYKLSLKTGQVEVLAKQLKFPSLAGYDSEVKALKLFHAFGDAGCFSLKAVSFNLDTKQLETASQSNFGSCSDDPDYEEQQNKQESFFNQYQKTGTKFFKVEDGRLLKPALNEKLEKETFPVSFVSE